jgi:hypothetical protein
MNRDAVEQIRRAREQSLRWGESGESRADRAIEPSAIPSALTRAPGTAAIRRVLAGTNVAVNDTAGDDPTSTQCEPAIATNGTDVLVAWNDWPSIDPTFLGSLQGWAYSNDGGATYRDAGEVPPPGEDMFWRSDPSLAADDRTGEFFYCGLMETLIDPITDTQDEGVAILSGRFQGSGFLWSAPHITRLGPISQHFIDKPWIAVDPTSGNLYVTYTDFFAVGNDVVNQIVLQRSTDRGATWGPQIVLSSAAAASKVQGSRPVVGPDGEVYVVWFEIGPSDVDFIRARKSTDRGASFGTEHTVSSFYDNFGTGAPGFNRELGLAFPSVGIDRSSGPQRGRVYVAWNESFNFFDDYPARIDPPVNEIETGDFYANATPFIVGETLQGGFKDSLDIDVFSFNAVQGNSYIFWADSVTALYKMRLNCGGDTLTRLAYSGHPDAPLDDNGNQGLIVWTCPRTGAYDLLMVCNDIDVGDYRIRTGLASHGVERGRDQRDVFVSSSLDGATWTNPTLVNDDPPGYDDWLPEVTVSNEGDVFVFWYDFRSSSGDPPDGTCGGLSNVYLARSQDGGSTWASMGAMADARTNWTYPFVIANLIPNQGDYLALCATEEAAFTAWTDGRHGTPDIFSNVIQLLPPELQTTRSATAEHADVQVTWRFRVPQLVTAHVYRDHLGERENLGVATSDASGVIVFTDPGVKDFERYTYRLGVMSGSTERLIGRIGVEVLGTTFQARPSLMHTFTTLVYSVPPAGADVTLKVFDVTGRAVRTLVGGFQGGGNQFVVWDRRDDHGHDMSPGVFFVRLAMGDTRATRRLVVLP